MQTWITAVSSASIGAVATLLAPILTEWFRTKRSSSISLPFADITGTWICKTNELSDRLVVDIQQGREVYGTRTFVGTDGIEHDYKFTGYFDGIVMALALTSTDSGQTRTLGIVLKRQDSDTFVGVRTYLDGRDHLIGHFEGRWSRV